MSGPRYDYNFFNQNDDDDEDARRFDKEWQAYHGWKDGKPPPPGTNGRAGEHHSTDGDQSGALGIWDAGDDDYNIPPREWLLGNTFCKKFLSSLIADGGVGKTALRIAQIGSLATGRSITGEHVFRRCRALILSFEDDRDELRRRVYAAMLKHGIKPAELKGWLFLAAPKGLKLAQMAEGSPQVGVLEQMLRDAITILKLDIVCLDPFVKTHGVNENDNNAIDFVCGLLAEIAIALNCAMDVPHHTNKGLAAAGDANKGRGATAAKDAARLVYTLTPMTPEEAKALVLDEGDRRFLVRYDSAKVNIAPPSIQAKWFRIVGMPLGNFTDTYPAGDNVQSVEPWIPPNSWAGTDRITLNLVLDDIDAGLPNGQRYSHVNAAEKRAAWPIVKKHFTDKEEAQCRAVISAWVKSGTLFKETYADPVEHKDRVGLSVDAAKAPVTMHQKGNTDSRIYLPAVAPMDFFIGSSLAANGAAANEFRLS
jgi:hypothetical protein